jgi:3-oxoacyl-[acyl-carrier protein] reductase
VADAVVRVAGVVARVGEPGEAVVVAGRQVTVNAVAPGFITTDMTKDLPEAVRQQMLEHIPLRAFGEVGDVAAAVAFLASKEARYITGQVLTVDGGLTM